MRKFQLNNITLLVTKDYEEMSKKGAELIANLIKENPTVSLGLATGGTPVGLYNELIRKHRTGEISFKKVSTFNLDEYYPIATSSPQSYAYFMKDKLFKHVDINIENTHIPNGMAKDINTEGEFYEKKVRSTGGVDLQLLGIGSDGHIGFNEPSSDFESVTHKVKLNPQTISDNARFFNDVNEVPSEAITMGIGTIMSAKSILLLANGDNKSTIVKQMLKGKVTPHIPASILQFHPNVTVILDEAAAKELCL